MSKFLITTALALVLAGGAYAQGHHGGGGGGGGGMDRGGISARVGGGGSGGAPSMSRGPSGPSNFNSMSRGPTGSVYNRAPTMNTNNRANGQNFSRNNSRFTERNNGALYNRYEGNRAEGNRFEGNRSEGRRNPDNRGVVQGNFFEHGRHFGFRRFFNNQWVFLTAWDSCTGWVWINVAPGTWAWTPINICIG